MTFEEALEKTIDCVRGKSIFSKLNTAVLVPTDWHVDAVKHALLPNEDILFVLPYLISVASLGTQLNGVFVITDQRVFVCDGNPEHSAFVQIPISSIESATLTGDKRYSDLTISSHNELFAVGHKTAIVSLAKEAIDTAIYNQSQKAASTETQPSSNETDTIQALKSYKELLDAGVITQEEFEKKKAQLLGI